MAVVSAHTGCLSCTSHSGRPLVYSSMTIRSEIHHSTLGCAQVKYKGKGLVRNDIRRNLNHKKLAQSPLSCTKSI